MHVFSLGQKETVEKKARIFPSKIEWDLTNGPYQVSCDRAIRYSGLFGVRSVGPVGDFLESFMGWECVLENAIFYLFFLSMENRWKIGSA